MKFFELLRNYLLYKVIHEFMILLLIILLLKIVQVNLIFSVEILEQILTFIRIRFIFKQNENCISIFIDT